MIYRILLITFFMLAVSNGDSFALDAIGSLLTPGDLCSAHARYEGVSNCTKCHKLGVGVPDEKCLECHVKLAKRIRKPGHSL